MQNKFTSACKSVSQFITIHQKFIWWLILVVSGLLFLYYRYDKVFSGQVIVADMIVFVVLTVLLISPLFTEVEILSFKFKSQLNEVKKEIKDGIQDLRLDIQTRVSQNVNTILNFPEAPTLDQKSLNKLGEKIKKYPPPEYQLTKLISLKVPDDSDDWERKIELFTIRFRIESQIRRWWNNSGWLETENVRYGTKLPVQKILDYFRLSNPKIADELPIIREMVAICNKVMHGEIVAEELIEFVRENSERVIGYITIIVDEYDYPTRHRNR